MGYLGPHQEGAMTSKTATPTNILLWDGWSLRHDGGRNWILCHEVTRKRRDGSEYIDEDVAGYYDGPGPAARAILRHELAGKGRQAKLESFITAITQAERKVGEHVERLIGALHMVQP
jgi:hypothetical protein